MYRIATIVEGHGEVQAVPVLLRRIVQQLAPTALVDLPRPIRAPRNRFVKHGEFQRTVNLAAGRAGSGGGVLILLDANGDCPATLGPELLQRAKRTRSDTATRVVLVKREYEAWFLAAAASIAGHRHISQSIASPSDPESVRDAKGWLSEHMPPGFAYSPTAHQAALSSIFDLGAARTASASFDKMCRDVDSLLRELGRTAP